jgi:hypothetical protein
MIRVTLAEFVRTAQQRFNAVVPSEFLPILSGVDPVPFVPIYDGVKGERDERK